MTRYRFGATAADFTAAVAQAGSVTVYSPRPATLTFWSAEVGGTQYTDLRFNDQAATQIAVGNDGQIPAFDGPDDVVLMWASGRSGARTAVLSVEGVVAIVSAGGGGGPVYDDTELRSALFGYDEDDASGAITLAAAGVHALDLTGDTTVTLTGTDGASVVLDVALDGHALTVEDATVDVDGPVQCLRSRGAWQVYPLNAGSDGGGGTNPGEGGGTDPGDTTAPTAPTLTVDNSSQTQLVATFSGGTDDTAVTQYRTRIDGGAWTVATEAGARTFTGLTAGTAHTIDAQAGDAVPNWSTSTSVTASTAPAGETPLNWTTVASDDFNAANGTAIVGRATPVGGLTWAARDAEKSADVTIQNNRASYSNGSFNTGSRLVLPSVPANIRASMSGMTFPSTTNPGFKVVIGIGYIGRSPNIAGQVALTLTATGSLSLSDLGYGNPSAVLTGQTTGLNSGGTFAVQMEGDGALTVLIDGTAVATAQVDGTIEGRVFYDGEAVYSFDDFTIETA